MIQRHATGPLDRDPDDRLTFEDVTLLVLLAVSGSALAAIVLLGTVSAAHRIAAVLGLA